MPLLPPAGRRPLLGGPPPPDPGAAPPMPGMDPGGGLPPGGPPMGGPPPGLLGGPLAGPGGLGGPQFPTTDPSAVAGLLGPLGAAQAQDQQQLQGQQMQAAVLALIDAMGSAPNPAAEAAMTEPGYSTPPPPDGVM